MISKTIHYCWFGHNPKPELVLRCIESWKRFAPGFEIREWNESNVDVNAHVYMREAYAAKKWAYVSDYARLLALRDHGGIYLDTDMLLMKDITPLAQHAAFIGKEDSEHISAGIIGVPQHHPYIDAVLAYYDAMTDRLPIPVILTTVFSARPYSDMIVYDPIYFYPFTSDTIRSFDGIHAPPESYAVHLWNYSWGNPIARFVKRVGLYTCLKQWAEALHIKSMLKRVLQME